MKRNIPLSINFREYVFMVLGRYFDLKKCPVIFCFHSVTNDGWLFNVNPKDFGQFIRKIMSSRKVVSLKNMLNGKGKNNEEHVSITFDDGYEDVFTNAYPILKKYGITACVFINGIPDKNGDFGYLDGRKLLSLDQIKKLKREGWEIGYHTKTHPDLRKLTAKQMNEEIIDSKNKLENILGFKLDLFAYPHGLFNKKVIRVVEKAGYKYAFTADGAKLDHKKSPFKISRVLADKYMKEKDISIITSCQGLRISRLYSSLLRLKDNLI